ncbi:hypothetical protein D3C77_589140 [compost metagenome]
MKQPDDGLGDVVLHLYAAADEYRVPAVFPSGRSQWPDRQVVAGFDFRAIQRHDRPAVELAPTDVVGHAQHFHRPGKRNHRKLRQQQESEMQLGRAGGVPRGLGIGL